MNLLDELRRMYGMQQPDPLDSMLSTEPPPPPELSPEPLDQQVLAATSGDMAQPMDVGAQPTSSGGAGHPDVLSFVKELEQKGAFGQREQPKAPKGMMGAQTTIESEMGGPSAADRAGVVAQRGQADLADGQVDAERQRLQAEELQKRAAYLRMDAEIEDEKRQKDEAQNAARQERLRAQQEELAAQSDEPINPDRYMQNKSIVAKGFALISAGIYGYLGGRGQPPVVESLMQMVKEDVAAQMQNQAANRQRRSALIDQYERQYGDTTLVAKRLEADKLLTLAKKARAEGMEAKSMDVKAAAEDLSKKLENQVGRIHSDIQQATWDKPVQVKTTYAPPKSAGGVDAFGQMKKGLELDKILEERGLPPDSPERRAARRMAGVDDRNLGDSKPVSEQNQQVKKDLDTRRRQYAEEDKDLADEEQAMVAAAKAIGGRYDAQSGELVLPKDMKGFGKGAFVNRVPFTDASHAREAIVNLADVKQRQRSGAAAPIAEAEKLTAITSGETAIDEASVAQALQTTAASLAARRRAAMIGAGEDVLESYQAEKKKLPGGLRVTPVNEKDKIRKALGR